MEVPAGKRCRHCGELKPLEAFHQDRSVKDGRRPACKACTAAERRVRYRKDPAAEIARVKAWQQANSARLNAYRRRRRQDPAVKRRARSGHLQRTFGISIEEYESRLEGQGGGCAICGRGEPPGASLHVDHDHETGRVRALLCVRCNNGIALFDEGTPPFCGTPPTTWLSPAASPASSARAPQRTSADSLAPR